MPDCEEFLLIRSTSNPIGPSVKISSSPSLSSDSESDASPDDIALIGRLPFPSDFFAGNCFLYLDRIV